MKKDIYLGKHSEWAKHSRNSALGRQGTNKLIRHNVKKAIRMGGMESPHSHKVLKIGSIPISETAD